MSTREKRLERIRTTTQNWTISDLEQVMLDYGIEFVRDESSHRRYRYVLNGQKVSFTLPVHNGKVKPFYVRKVRDRIEEVIVNE